MNYTQTLNLQRRNSLYRRELKIKATPQEIIFTKYLYEQHVKFIFQKGFFTPFHRIVDFYIKRFRLIVEIDGGYHKNIADKDSYKDFEWGRRGFKTLRILNEDVDNGKYRNIFASFIMKNYNTDNCFLPRK